MERGSFGDILHSSKRVFLVLHAKYLIIPFLEYSPQIPHIPYVQMAAGNIYINVIKKLSMEILQKFLVYSKVISKFAIA